MAFDLHISSEFVFEKYLLRGHFIIVTELNSKYIYIWQFVSTLMQIFNLEGDPHITANYPFIISAHICVCLRILTASIQWKIKKKKNAHMPYY